MQKYLAYALVVYFVLIVATAFFAKSKMESEEDFIVGGRSFNLWLTTFCLFATWFGAGTLMTATDEVAAEGLRITALEPYGAGVCLLLAGFFFAKPLWNMKLMTVSDLYRNKYGQKVETLSVFLNIPIYVGWIAVQIVSLAQILAVFFPVPVWVFMIAVTLLACFLTVIGGLWSVSLTDSFQLVVIIAGLFYLFFRITGGSIDTFDQMLSQVSPEKMVLIPTEKMSAAFKWFGVFCVSALGNMTGQDLGQRMFSAKSAKTAQWGCYLSGLGYIFIGSIPVFLGLTAHLTLGEYEGAVLPNLVRQYLDPISGVILMITIVSAVMSTMTSALLAPASVFSHNFLSRYFKSKSKLFLCKVSVVFMAAVSLLTAFAGQSVYGLLESSYSVAFVGLFVPVVIALYSKKLSEKACLITIVCCVTLWLPEMFGYDEWPLSLFAVALGFPIYFLAYRLLNGNSEPVV